MFETTDVSLGIVRSSGRVAGRAGGEKKKVKVDVCSVEVCRGGQHTALAQHSPSCEEQTQGITEAPRANKQVKSWPCLRFNAGL